MGYEPTNVTMTKKKNQMKTMKKPSFLTSLRADAAIAENTDIRAPNAAKRREIWRIKTTTIRTMANQREHSVTVASMVL